MKIRIEWPTGFMELDYKEFTKLAQSNQKQYNAIMQFALENGGWKVI